MQPSSPALFLCFLIKKSIVVNLELLSSGIRALHRQGCKLLMNGSFKRRSILFIIVLLTPLSGMGVDIVAPSLPYISSWMGAPETVVSLSVSAYVFGYGFSQIFYGVVSDVVGRKRPILFSLITFALVSAWLPHVTSVVELIMLRCLQGVAVAGSTALARSVVTDVFSPKQRKNVSNYLVIAWGAGPIVSPLIGAHLLELSGWGASFYFLGCYAAVAALLVILMLPETCIQKTVSVRESSVNVIRLLRDVRFMLSASLAGLCLSLLYTFNVFSSYILIDRHDFSAIEYGNILIFVGSAWLVGSFTNRLLLSNYDDSLIQPAAAWLALSLSIVICAFQELGFGVMTSYIIPSFFIIFAVNIVFTRNFGICLSLHPDKAGVAGAMTGTVFIVVSSLTMSVVSLFQTEGIDDMARAFFLICGLIVTVMSIRIGLEQRHRTVEAQDG